MNSTEELIVRFEADAGEIIFNRPHLHNAISRDMWQKLPEHLSRLVDRGARAVVLSGAGDSFVSGADLSDIKGIDSYGSARIYWFGIRDCLNHLYRLPVPVIAKIDGACLGGGLLLALACDMRVATTRSIFALPVARLGILLDPENISRLVNTAGLPLAAELLYTAGTVSSGRAFAAGLVNKLCEEDRLDSEVSALVKNIVSNEWKAVASAKDTLLKLSGAGGAADKAAEAEIVDSYLRAAARAEEEKPGS